MVTGQKVTRLHSYPPIWKESKSLAEDRSFDLTFAVWKQSVALSLPTDYWAAYNLAPRVFAVIGDGYGFSGALIRRHFPNSRVYSVDLPKILLFQAHAHEIADHIDCAFNMASMQEMNDYIISPYFNFHRSRSTPSSRFYCVNQLRIKLPEGEVTSFLDYPWHHDDEVFIDGRCPYYTHFAGRTGLNRPRVFGMRVPFINYFDGPVMHRLVHLTSAYLERLMPTLVGREIHKIGQSP